MREDLDWLSDEERAYAGWRRASEFTRRTGLPNVLRKIASGGPVRVAYLGGSITEQAGWRVYSLEYLRRRFPDVAFEEIQAAIGGTNSQFGAYRLGKDVLAHRPDLMFVEFATNDGSVDRSRDVEGIVRSFFEGLPESDICFVYTVAGPAAQSLLERGWCSVGASAYEDIADHYGIPSIHMGVEAARLAAAGRLRWRMSHEEMHQVAGDEFSKTSGPMTSMAVPIAFSEDGTHPYLDTGHRLYAEAVERSLDLMWAAEGEPRPHAELPEPINGDYMRQVRFYSVEEALEAGMTCSGESHQDTTLKNPDWEIPPPLFLPSSVGLAGGRRR